MFHRVSKTNRGFLFVVGTLCYANLASTSGRDLAPSIPKRNYLNLFCRFNEKQTGSCIVYNGGPMGFNPQKPQLSVAVDVKQAFCKVSIVGRISKWAGSHIFLFPIK